jgi:hypothetical protein
MAREHFRGHPVNHRDAADGLCPFGNEHRYGVQDGVRLRDRPDGAAGPRPFDARAELVLEQRPGRAIDSTCGACGVEAVDDMRPERRSGRVDEGADAVRASLRKSDMAEQKIVDRLAFDVEHIAGHLVEVRSIDRIGVGNQTVDGLGEQIRDRCRVAGIAAKIAAHARRDDLHGDEWRCRRQHLPGTEDLDPGEGRGESVRRVVAQQGCLHGEAVGPHIDDAEAQRIGALV